MTDCLFCKIIAGDIPASPVFENESVLAFNDINPQAPTHVLVIPKTHTASAGTASQSVLGQVMAAAAQIARTLKLDENGYRLVTNIGKDGGQSVDHLHIHLLGGRPLLWPPG